MPDGSSPRDTASLVELNVEYATDLDTAVADQHRYWAGTYVPAFFYQKIYTPSMSAQVFPIHGTASTNTYMMYYPICSNTVSSTRARVSGS